MKIQPLLIVALSGMIFLTQSALAIETPPGWKVETHGAERHYTPETDTGFDILLRITPPHNNMGKSAAEWAKTVARFFAGGGPTINVNGDPVINGDRATISMTLERPNGRRYLQITVYPLNAKQLREIAFMIRDDAELRQRYQPVVDSMIDAQYAEDHAGAAANADTGENQSSSDEVPFVPAGWSGKHTGNVTLYTPQDSDKKIFIVSVYDPMPDAGMNRTAWLEFAASGIAKAYDKVLEHDAVDSAGELVVTNYRLEEKGQKLYANFTAFPAGKDKMRLVLVICEEDAALLQRFQEDAKQIIAAYFTQAQ